ncbi:MAG: transcription activator effector binding [Anaerocolumna sp.]|jgi:hypothetical protein|nr:transcription activator effector binding [Anaerocolumna sp.]
MDITNQYENNGIEVCMQTIRIINIPALKVVSSGAITNMDKFKAFDNWWSDIDVKNYITPRDFMWYNEKEKYVEWIFAVPESHLDYNGYNLIDFPGGLYAVGTSKNTDEEFKSNREDICKWVSEHEYFELSSLDNDLNIRYTMNHVITPKIFEEKMGYHLSDIFVPIVIK